MRFDGTTESRSEIRDHDCDTARAVALHAASIVGVDADVLDSIRAVDILGGAHMTAADWLRCALDADRERKRAEERAACFGAGAWVAIHMRT